MTLTPRQRERYDRNLRVPGIGEEGQRRLRDARVLVVGAGGLGSPALLYLASAGVGHLAVADDDVVEFTNLQRQVIHAESDVGRPKTESAAATIRALNSEVEVETLGWFRGPGMADLVRRYDVALDCTDTFGAKYDIADACAEAGTPLVWGTIVSMSYQVAVLWSRPPAGRPAITLRDIHPEQPEPGTTEGAPQVGVLGAVAGQAGTVMAVEAIKLLTGVGEPLLGRILVADTRAGRWDVIDVVPR